MDTNEHTYSVIVDNETIGYRQYGNGPKLLLIHGFGIDSNIWRNVIPELSKIVTVITLDLRGYGLNSSTTNSVDTISQTNFLTKFIDGIDGVDYILGYSYGGRIVYEYAKKPHNNIQKVFIMQTPFFKSRMIRLIKGLFNFSGKNKHIGTVTKYIVTRYPLKEALMTMFGIMDISNKEVFDECVKRFLFEPNVEAVFKGTAHLFEPIHKITLEQFKVPFHFIYGSHDKFAKVSMVKRIMPFLKNSKLDIVDGVFHLLPLEKPKELAAILISEVKK